MTDTPMIPDELTPTVTYVVQASEDTFTYKFYVVSADDMYVYVNGVEISDSNYTITGIGDRDGGFVEIDTSLEPLSPGDTVTLSRFTLPEQITEFLRTGDFTADSVNAEFNRLYALLQEQAEVLARTIKTEQGESAPTYDELLSIVDEKDAETLEQSKQYTNQQVFESGTISPGSLGNLTDYSFKYIEDIDGTDYIKVDDLISVEDYADGVGSGRLFFKVVAAGTGVHDGGKYIDLVASGLQLQQNLRRPYNVAAWGSKPDDVTVNTDAWQSAIDYVKSVGSYELHHNEGVHVVGALVFPSEGFTCVGVAGPRNQTIAPCLIRAASAGINMFTPDISDSPTVVSNPKFKDTVLAGFDENDITTKCIYFDPSVICYGFELDNVGFLNCDFGWWMQDGFNIKVRFPHGWNCATAIGYCGDGPSTVLENPRCGKVPAGDQTSITGITKANPAVVTAPGHGITDGRLVWIDDGGDMTEVSNKIFIADNVTSNTFELRGIDSTSYATYTSGAKCNRAACGYWLGGPNTLVVNADTAAELSGIGSVMFIVGEADSLSLRDGFTTSHAHFDTCHFEGVKGAFVWVTSGSNATYNDPHFITSSQPMPRGVYYEFLNDMFYIHTPKFTVKDGGYYTWNIEVDSFQRTKAKIDVIPYAADELPTINKTDTGLAEYNVGLYGFSAQMNANLPVASATETEIAFGNELFDTDAIYNGSTGDFTPDVKGLYIPHGEIFITNGEVGAVYQVRILVDGVELQRNTVIASSTSGFSVSLPDAPLSIVGGETVNIAIWHNATTANVNTGFRSKVSILKK